MVVEAVGVEAEPGEGTVRAKERKEVVVRLGPVLDSSSAPGSGEVQAQGKAQSQGQRETGKPSVVEGTSDNNPEVGEETQGKPEVGVGPTGRAEATTGKDKEEEEAEEEGALIVRVTDADYPWYPEQVVQVRLTRPFPPAPGSIKRGQLGLPTLPSGKGMGEEFNVGSRWQTNRKGGKEHPEQMEG
ncbi:unnamed protein product, partial [Discosporangium mesarthrocarpum]